MDVRQTLDAELNPTQEVEHPHSPVAPTGFRLGILSLAALGVVYGDIGTTTSNLITALWKTRISRMR
ncbi:MAG: KUP/HAK/KT family potassium transporter [Acidobacteriota bacterium]|nr:KUP/HAK/KT family potassium transporter [Acidobacteriota bacterium]